MGTWDGWPGWRRSAPLCPAWSRHAPRTSLWSRKLLENAHKPSALSGSPTAPVTRLRPVPPGHSPAGRARGLPRGNGSALGAPSIVRAEPGRGFSSEMPEASSQPSPVPREGAAGGLRPQVPPLIRSPVPGGALQPPAEGLRTLLRPGDRRAPCRRQLSVTLYRVLLVSRKSCVSRIFYGGTGLR